MASERVTEIGTVCKSRSGRDDSSDKRTSVPKFTQCRRTLPSYACLLSHR